MLDRLEIRYGADAGLRRRLLPIVVRVFESSPPSQQRPDMLRLVVQAYAKHMTARKTVDELRERLRCRINETYGKILGIEPPRIG